MLCRVCLGEVRAGYHPVADDFSYGFPNDVQRCEMWCTCAQVGREVSHGIPYLRVEKRPRPFNTHCDVAQAR
jgi:hypothetical protein